MKAATVLIAACAALVLVGCAQGDLETRTFELEHLRAPQAAEMIRPYVFTDREGAPGAMSASGSAITVRETPDNLDRIERTLERFDRAAPLVMLHFQIIRANGASAADPAIEDVERELRRLFRFEGYELLAETRVGSTEGSRIRQLARGGGEEFLIEGGVLDVAPGGESPIVTLEVRLMTNDVGEALTTQVTVPAGHAVVLGTAETRTSGALILVVRAEIAGGGTAPPPDTASPNPG